MIALGVPRAVARPGPPIRREKLAREDTWRSLGSTREPVFLSCWFPAIYAIKTGLSAGRAVRRSRGITKIV